ncbi:hypothetical protein PP707_05335 [Acetobacter pasteurianus]|nr:hypothetical protein [Acetobacter pasteurianus]
MKMKMKIKMKVKTKSGKEKKKEQNQKKKTKKNQIKSIKKLYGTNVRGWKVRIGEIFGISLCFGGHSTEQKKI